MILQETLSLILSRCRQINYDIFYIYVLLGLILLFVEYHVSCSVHIEWHIYRKRSHLPVSNLRIQMSKNISVSDNPRKNDIDENRRHYSVCQIRKNIIYYSNFKMATNLFIVYTTICDL